LVPLHLATLGGIFVLLTKGKGRFWGSDRAPKASGARRGHPAQATANPA